MANFQFSLSLDKYCSLIALLSQDKSFEEVVTAIRDNAYIVADENKKSRFVRVKVDRSFISAIISYLLPADSTVTEEIDPLMKVFEERMQAEQAADAARDEYNTWLRSCFDKYVETADAPNCKELAVLINNNELKQGMPRIKYQSLIRPLKAYRSEKFNI